jgi:nucleoside-diphosphate-sugar epimerase
MKKDFIINYDDLILVTGAGGFIGAKLVECLLQTGFNNLRCFVRPSSNRSDLQNFMNSFPKAKVEIFEGNLLTRNDCAAAATSVKVVYHLAASADKSFSGTFMNTTVTTRNILDALLQNTNLKRFVNVSSFAVYSGMKLRKGTLLDENCPIEEFPLLRGAYCYGKIKQDELLYDYSSKFNLPYVVVRPGAVYGPGKNAITGRVGIDTFGFFIHLGGSNQIPFSYVDNCAEAIMLAGIIKDVEGEVFNIVDDDLPSSRKFLRLYKKNVGRFKSIYIPWWASYLFCRFWEKYSIWSRGQLPLAFTRNRWAAEWKGHKYSNEKMKNLLGWTQKVQFDEASKRYFDFIKDCKKKND